MAGGGMLLLRVIPWMLRSKVGRILLLFGVLAVVGAHFLGIDLLPLLAGGGQSTTTSRLDTAEEREMVDFVSVILADTEETWHREFGNRGLTYREPKLVLFSGSVRSNCGFAEAAMGPFYCPADEKLYIDLSFYEDLKSRHGAPGDFAQAYVIAHEVGHHVQNLLGISTKVRTAQANLSKVEANQLSVKQELQADCFAGVWGHHANTERDMLETGDLEEALAAAAAIGDDRLQKQSTGYVTPDSFTHGSSEQRVQWFKQGFQSGQLDTCDTFNAL